MIDNSEKPKAVMLSSIPQQQMIAECTFFGGDTLSGFDLLKEAGRMGSNSIYVEFKGYILWMEEEFVKRKYKLSELPSEARRKSKTPKAIQPPVVLANACTNLDMEAGDFSNWAGTHGYNTNSNAPFTVVNSGIPYNTDGSYTDCSYYELITGAYGTDHFGGFPGVFPDGGSFSARVGSEYMNLGKTVACNGVDQDAAHTSAEEVHQTYVVTAANALLTYHYAVILNDATNSGTPHPFGAQPYFEAVVQDAGGNVLSTCTDYYQQVISGSVPAGYTLSGFASDVDGTEVYYLPWTSNTVNLTPYIGSTVTVKFIASGCIFTGHFAYAYVEGTCGPVDVTITPYNPCAGGTGVLTAPTVAGGTYSWIGPGIIGPANTQSVTVNVTGTYSVTITPVQGPGCAYTLSVPITFNSPSISGSSSTPTNCTSSTGTASANLTGGTGAYTYAWTPGGQTTSTATGLGQGNYTVVVTDGNGCTIVGTQSVSIFPPVVAGFSVTVVCLGNPTQFTDQSNAATTSWNWNFGDGTSAGSVPNPSHTYTASGVYTATLTASGAGGCSDVITQSVTVNPQPIANFSVTTVCFGNPTQFTDQSTGGANQWSWNFGDGTSAGSVPNPSHTYTAAGTYTATLISTATPGGCNSTIANVVTVLPQPVASFTATTVCLLSATQFTDLSTGGATQWSWDFGDGSSASTVPSPSHTYTASGTYTATLVVTANPGGCNSTVTQIVIVNPQPDANFSVTTVCLGLATQFTDQSVGGGTQWSWNFGDGTPASTVPSPSHTYTAAGTYTATLTVTGPGGCNSTLAKQVTVFSISVANFTTADICLNKNPAVFIDQSTGVVLWTWNFGDGTPTSGQPNPTHVYGAPGTYTVSLLVQSGGACIDSIKHVINVNPVPDANFTSNIVCFNNPTQFTDQSLGAPNQWSWDFGDGTLPLGSGPNPTHMYGAPGTYTVTMIATNSLGCSDTLPLTAIVNPVPSAAFNAPTVCIGSASCFQDLSSIAPPDVISGWSWNFNDPASGASNISSIQSPCHLYSSVGTYSVTLTVTTNNSCQTSVNLPVTVTVPPVASFTATTVCLNNPTSFKDLSTGAVGWSWSFGDGGTSTTQNPSHTYLGYGTYIVTLVASAGGICTDTITDTITVNPVPIVVFTSDSVCVGMPSSFTDVSFMPSGSIIAWGWDFGDPASGINNTSNLQNPTHIFSSAGTFSVTLTATSAGGCLSSKMYTALVYAGPTADFSFSPGSPVRLTDVISYTDLSGGSPVQWWWNFGDNDTSVLQNPEHSYPDLGTYTITLIVINQNGCPDTIMKPLEILQFSFYIPNAFTPGIDGKNDFFFGKGVGIVEYEMHIFDRWGNLIFYCNIKDLPQSPPCWWDGKVEAGASNEKVQQDVYVWKVKLLDIFGESHKYIGTVTVVK